MMPFRAPDADGGLLILPALPQFGDLLQHNQQTFATTQVSLAGIALGEIRQQAAHEVLALVNQYHRHFGESVPTAPPRFIVGGHQPELFHAGVWAKNFALHSIARQHGLTPLNLIVDNDTIKTAELRLPHVASEPTQVSQCTVAFDQLTSEIPYEEYRVQERGHFDTFPQRLAAHTQAWGYTPLLHELWPDIVAMVDRGCALGNVFSAVRRRQERAWGVTNVELPVSRLTETTAFRLFTQHLLDQLPTFTAAYNGAIRSYRQRNHLRSRNHPAPELLRQGDWLETPFWAWHRDHPTRQKLFARHTTTGIELRHQQTTFAQLRQPNSWDEFSDAGWKIRPRALTLTMFVRLCLAEAFMHGIGGGKYDEVTDEIIRRFVGIEPPGYAVVSATLRLPLPIFPATVDDRRRVQRQLRDLNWNPQATTEAKETMADLVAAKETLAQQNPNGHQERRQWFRELQRLTAALRPAATQAIPQTEARLAQIEHELQANIVLRRRDYAWPLFPANMLRDYFTRSFDIH